MVDLSGSIPPGRRQVLPTDPGNRWRRDNGCTIDAPPDGAIDPPADAVPDPSARRTGAGGVVAPRIVRIPQGGYRMYYTQILPRPGFPAGAVDYENATSRILSAFSDDGIRWTPEPGVRLSSQQGGAGEYRVVSADVVPTSGRAGQLRMYYECTSSGQWTSNAIRSARSDDGGLTWIVDPGVRLTSAGQTLISPRAVLLDDGGVRLYCGERGRGIVSALAGPDGLVFSEEPGTRVARGGPHDAFSAFAPEIIRLPDGNYVMYYAGYSERTRANILRATSADGLSWTKGDEPVILPGREDPTNVKCSEMCVIPLPHPKGAEPAYRMFYEACDGTAPEARGVWRIWAATSMND